MKNDPIDGYDIFGLAKGIKYGNYCGGAYCGGKELKPGEKCDYSVPAEGEDGMDQCCKTHDKCYDDNPKRKSKCDKAMCDCLKNNVDAGEFTTTNQQITFGKLVTFACAIKGGGTFS